MKGGEPGDVLMDVLRWVNLRTGPRLRVCSVASVWVVLPWYHYTEILLL